VLGNSPMLDGGFCEKSPLHPPYEKSNGLPHLLGPKRSILEGLVKLLAVGYGLSEASHLANRVVWPF